MSENNLFILQNLMAHAHGGLAYLDSLFNFIEANQTFAHICQCSRAALIGQNLFGRFPNQEVKAIFQSVVETGEPFNVQDYPVAIATEPSPGFTYWDWTLTPIKDNDGNVSGLVLSVFETTGRKRAELELTKQENRYRDLVENHPVLVHSFLPDTSILYSNPLFNQYLNKTPEQVIGQRWINWISADERQSLLDYFASFTADMPVKQYENTFPLADGSKRWLLWSNQAFFDEAGHVTHFQSLGIDITERKQAEAELAKIHQKLEQQVHKRTEQLSKLTSELVLAEHRERRKLAEQLHDNLQQILIAARLHLEQLSELAEPQMQVVHKVETLINESIEVSRSLTQDLSPPILFEAGLTSGLEWLVRRKKQLYNLDVELIISKEAAAMLNIPDDVKILVFQSIREILFNIVKHAGVKSAVMTLRMLRHNIMQITISDEGVGFDVSHLKSIEYMGNIGLGLFSVTERLRSLGGSFEIRSFPNQGTLVILTVPLKLDSPVAPIEPHPLLTIEKPTALSPVIKILLVDDHVVLREGLMSVLSAQSEFMIVGQAANGLEAIEQARRLQPDFILMDVSMPGIDGILATRVIHSEMPEICIIGLSMYDFAERADAMLNAGAKAYFNKKEDISKIISFIKDNKPS